MFVENQETQENQRAFTYADFGRNVVWVLGAMFVVSGLIKFTGTAGVIDNFVDWGYPAWFALLAGGVELIGGLLLLFPGPNRTFFGAVILSLHMFAAFFTHFVHGEAMLAAVPIGLSVLLLMTAYRFSYDVLKNMERLLYWAENPNKKPSRFSPKPSYATHS